MKMLLIGLAVAVSASQIASRLETIKRFESSVSVTITPPAGHSDVHYTLKIHAAAAPDDTVYPAEYLIEKRAATDSLAGFAAYTRGHFYRYRPGRLSEYHDGDLRKSAEAGASQFGELLPHSIARAAAEASSLTVTETAEGYRVAIADADGSGRTAVYTLRPTDCMPIKAEIVYNPGQASEQTVYASYSYPEEPESLQISESMLRQRYPEQFSRYRTDGFLLTSLVGSPLPGFALPTLDGRRAVHHRGEPLGVPTVIAFVDSSVDGTAQFIAILRQALESLPFSTALVMAFTDNDRESISAQTGSPRSAETIAVSARGMARDCGVTTVPTLIFCNPDATVSDIHIGRNNDLSTIVIQKTSLARKL